MGKNDRNKHHSYKIANFKQKKLFKVILFINILAVCNVNIYL